MRYQVRTIPGVRCQCYGVWDSETDSWVWNTLPGNPAKATRENAEKMLRIFFPESSIPQPLPNPSWRIIKGMAENIVLISAETGSPPKDYEHYLFETVMESIYGSDFWEWWRKNVTVY